MWDCVSVQTYNREMTKWKTVFKININTPLILSNIPFCCSVTLTQLCLNFWDTMDWSTPGLSVPHHLLMFAQVHVHCISDAIQPSHPPMPSTHSALIFSSIWDFFRESVVRISWPKYWSFSFSISFSNKYSELISLKIDRFNLLAVWGTLRSLLQHHSSKASILRHSAFFTVQLSQSYMTTGKTRALTIWTFADRVMSLLFNTLCLSSLYWPEAISSDFTAAVTIHSDFRAQEEEICHDFHLSPSICHEVMGSDAVILVFFFFFLILSCRPALSLSSFICIKRLFSSSLLSALKVVSSAYLRLLMFYPSTLIPACNSSNWASYDMLSISTKQTGWQQTTLYYSFLNLEPINCSLQGFSCFFLTRIQVCNIPS